MIGDKLDVIISALPVSAAVGVDATPMVIITSVVLFAVVPPIVVSDAVEVSGGTVGLEESFFVLLVSVVVVVDGALVGVSSAVESAVVVSRLSLVAFFSAFDVSGNTGGLEDSECILSLLVNADVMTVVDGALLVISPSVASAVDASPVIISGDSEVEASGV